MESRIGEMHGDAVELLQDTLRMIEIRFALIAKLCSCFVNEELSCNCLC